MYLSSLPGPASLKTVTSRGRIGPFRRALVAGLLCWFASPVSKALAQALPGTEALVETGDFAEKMLDGFDRYLIRATDLAPAQRAQFWQTDFSSPAAYEKSVEANRARFRQVIGVVDRRLPFDAPSRLSVVGESPTVGSGAGFKVYAVRWPVLNGLDAEGLLLEPDGTPTARIIALPDADESPEALVGLEPGVPPERQFARQLAENGARVLVPMLINRSPAKGQWGKAKYATSQPNREFIYRMAYQVGRHIIGYEVQKVLAAVDWFEKSAPSSPVGVIGYGEGAVIALSSAACDRRIQSTGVIGSFAPRESIWSGPIYRNVWGFVREFGDAELAGLVAPRSLGIQANPALEISGPPPSNQENGRGAAPGRLEKPSEAAVRSETDRAGRIYQRLGAPAAFAVGNASEHVWRSLTQKGLRPLSPTAARLDVTASRAAERHQRQMEQLVDHIQAAVRDSASVRKEFWRNADASSIARWNETKEEYRRYMWEEVLGKLPAATEPLQARTRQIMDEPKWRAYEVQLPVLPDVFAYGVLLVPNDLKPGEKLPVVVAQHGRAGRPMDLIRTSDARTKRAYKEFAAQLADRRYIVYAPQNPYIFEERYRIVQRRANPLKLTLFSFILAQHERTLDWLATLPFVDPSRIGFYGLSYGGKTAVRVPPLLNRYALSICSGDFNEYARKMAGLEMPMSFMYTIEYETYEFNLAGTFDYSEMANLMAPKPFMVERGHDDGVGVDEWVAYEYAKVRRFYTRLKIPERTAIEFFDGIHEINAKGTFEFLDRHLKNAPAAATRPN